MAAIALALASCTFSGRHEDLETASPLNVSAPIFPCYADSLVLPPNIAPLDFEIRADSFSQKPYRVRVYVQSPSGILMDSIVVKTKKFVRFPLDAWQRCLQNAARCKGVLLVDIYGHQSINQSDLVRYKRKVWQVTSDSIDPYLVYRLSAHDENPCFNLQVYERSLSDFSKRLLMDNRVTDNNCMNCHVNSNNNSQKMLVHLRGPHAGTLIFNDNETIKIAIPEGYPDLRLAYPSWSREGRYIAFAGTRIQVFPHANRYRTQDVIADTLGKILIYDVAQNRLFSCPQLSDAAYEFSFPAWSADGKTLYFCRAERSSDPKDFKYNLCSIGFDPNQAAFDTVRLVHDFKADGVSVSMPQADPSGRYILATTLLLGSFPSQNQGDLCLIDLRTGEVKNADRLNSEDGEKYHTWSSNGCWVVFGSKRINGGTAQIYIAHFDKNGRFSTPFVLPQEEAGFYLKNTRSFLFPTLSQNASNLTLEKWEKAVKQPAQAPNMDYFKTSYRPGMRSPEAGH